MSLFVFNKCTLINLNYWNCPKKEICKQTNKIVLYPNIFVHRFLSQVPQQNPLFKGTCVGG